jgi:ABC-type multidrug transport system permease subunit
MFRAIWLTVQNEARLLFKDPMVLLMLLFAPVVIITVAGYSLGSLYGGVASSFRLPVIDLDHGPVAKGIIEGLGKEHSVTLETLNDVDEARRFVSGRDRTPLAIEIPAGTSNAIADGDQAHIIVFVDPVRRVEVNALELRIDELCRAVTEQAQATAQNQLNNSDADLRAKIENLSTSIKQEQEQLRARLVQTRNEINESIRAQTETAMNVAAEQTQKIIKLRENQAWNGVQQQLESRQAILMRIQDYLTRLQSTQQSFQAWIEKLKTLAGSHASDIPPPPAFPAPPSQSDLDELSKPIAPPKLDEPLLNVKTEAPAIAIPKLPEFRESNLPTDLKRFEESAVPKLPGDLGFLERPAIEGEPVIVNAFDQYVPGFGITFLLIGMMLGIALTLFDERDWGTLRRLRVSGAPLTGLVIGKLVARFVVGAIQMVILFAFGWWLFGISLGRQPIALLIPIAGISFAGATLGLVIASISQAHDSVMPLGTVLSMAMAAIGGCWWPLDFEPGWMRQLARWMPTTWTMQAFNDLMIRKMPASATLWPFAMTVCLGTIFLVVGLIRFVSIED